MRFTNIFTIYRRTRMITNAFVRQTSYNQAHSKRFILCGSKSLSRVVRHVNTIQDDSFDEIDYTSYSPKVEEGNVRDLLFNDSKDLLLSRIYCCASIQELFKVLESNGRCYTSEHITQTVLVLYDLKKIYCEMNHSKQAEKYFIEKLGETNGFQKLLQLTEEQIDEFNTETLSYMLLYLSKLGLSVDCRLFQQISERLKMKLLDTFSISSASRFLETVFSDTSLRSYFMSQELVPFVLKEIDLCDSVQHLDYLSVSLNKLHHFVTDGDLEKYKTKVGDLLDGNRIVPTDFRVVLQIVSLLNYPKWRDKNSVLISRCMLLIKDNLNMLSPNELLLLYEIFYKNQEPSEILSNLQRSASTLFHKLDDTQTPQKLALFSTLVYYASPLLKADYQKTITKYVKLVDDYNDLLLLRKPMSHLKISDFNLCRVYWDKMLNFLKAEPAQIDVIKLCHNYMSFHVHTDNYRHKDFELEVLKVLKKQSTDPSFACFPQKLSDILNFAVLFGDDSQFLEALVDKLEANWGQLSHLSALRLALCLKIFDEMDKNYANLSYAKRMNKILRRVVSAKVETLEVDTHVRNVLMKTCIMKKNMDWKVVDKLLDKFKSGAVTSSKSVENIVYCFLTTHTLIPNVLDAVTDYIITYKDHVLGFNIGRSLYLCFVLGYQPKNANEFFEIAINSIIRNQERMTGLSLIYSALSLCFFNKLPGSIIKSIFNVEFMDKLDRELQNCHSREKYPQRVRNYLMQLNRAVCLDYPESNVPWFHKKYIEDGSKDKKRNNIFVNNVREYLKRIVFDTSALAENVITPYGYVIDFVVYLDSQDEIDVDPTEFSKRLALFLLPEYSFTRTVVQLKGHIQLKKRHLEILGYKVIVVKYSEWVTLFYAEERLKYLSSLIWPKKCSDMNKINSI